MGRLWKSFCLSLFIYALLFSTAHCFAATPLSKNIEVMRDSLADRQEIVNDWKRDRQQEIYLALAVGGLGLVISACQTSEHPKRRFITLGLGVIVSFLTLCTNTFYQADFHSLGRAISSAKTQLETMKNDLKLCDPNMEIDQFKPLQTDFIAAGKRFDDIERDTVGTGSESNDKTPVQPEKTLLEKMSPVTVVYAQSSAQADKEQPTWIYSRPTRDSLGMYFIGRSNDPSLEKAKTDSYINATRQAIKTYELTTHQAISSSRADQLQELLKQFGDVTDTWVERSGTNYTYYTRLRVSNRIFDVDLNPASQDASASSASPSQTKVIIDNDSAVKVPNTDVLLLLQHLKEQQKSSYLYAISPGPRSSGAFQPYVSNADMAQRNVSLLRSVINDCDKSQHSVQGYSVQCFHIRRDDVANGKTKDLGRVTTSPSGSYQLQATGFGDTRIEVRLFLPAP
jgi:hypothetical protein